MFAFERKNDGGGALVEKKEDEPHYSTRILFRCNPAEVSTDLIAERLQNELGKKVTVIKFEVEPGTFQEKVQLSQTTRYIPISFVRAWYSW